MSTPFRRLLELIGVIEPKQASVKRKLNLLSQTKVRGPADVIVRSVGSRRISALAAIRKVSGLSLDESIIFSELLPWPLLRKVSLEVAKGAMEELERVGVEAELVSDPLEPNLLPGKKVVSLRTKAGSAPTADSAGNYTVTLLDVGLLEHRVVERLQALAEFSEPQAQSLCANTPGVIVSGVDVESAHRIQRELQMVGAVVDVVELPEIEGEQDADRPGGFAPPTLDDDAAGSGEP